MNVYINCWVKKYELAQDKYDVMLHDPLSFMKIWLRDY